MTRTLAGIPEQPTTAPLNGRDRFTGVYAAYWPRTVRFIAHQVWPSDWHTVEDLAQTTFERAWRFRDTARADDGDLFGWLSAIARNVVRAHYSRTPHLAAETPVAPDAPLWSSARCSTATATNASSSNTPPVLATALADLPAETRHAVELSVANGMPGRAVAQTMHRGRATVRRLVDDGIAALRTQLADDAAPPPSAHDATDPIVRTRRALAEIRQRRAVEDRTADDEGRAQELARWHADDQAREHAADSGALAMTADGDVA